MHIGYMLLSLPCTDSFSSISVAVYSGYSKTAEQLQLWMQNYICIVKQMQIFCCYCINMQYGIASLYENHFISN